jgi:hypothetical protein
MMGLLLRPGISARGQMDVQSEQVFQPIRFSGEAKDFLCRNPASGIPPPLRLGFPDDPGEAADTAASSAAG